MSRRAGAAPPLGRVLAAALAAVAVLCGAVVVAAPAGAVAGEVVRVHGQSRYLTAAALAQYAYPGDGVPVYLATGANYPDALAAAGAGRVLLVGPAGIPAAVERELARLRPRRVVVVGGPTVVSEAVVTAARRHAPEVRRLWGADRFATAAEVSRDRYPGGAPVAYLATGLDYPDALAASAAAARAGGPLLLTTGTDLGDATRAELARLRPRRIVVVGADAVVAQDVVAQASLVAPVTRLHGPTRYATAADVARASGAASTVVLVTGHDFPDAVVAGAAAARWGAPLLLTPPGRLSADAASVLRDLRPARVVLVGGAPVLSSGVADQARALLGAGATYRDVPLRLPGYAAEVREIDAATQARMKHSHRSGCPVAIRDLRLLRMSHVGFDGDAHTGEMVVAAAHAGRVTRVFGRLYEARFPVQRMVLVDEYGGSDDLSMAANNTSGYNCRRTTSGRSWSEHAYGTAVDINPVQNPYVRGGTVLPDAGRGYLDRGHRRPGMVVAGDAVVRAFEAEGWKWGGYWSSAKDYQHFSASGR